MEHTLRVIWSEKELVNCMVVHDGYLVNESTLLKQTESQAHASTSTPVGNWFLRLRPKHKDNKDFTPPLVPYMILEPGGCTCAQIQLNPSIAGHHWEPTLCPL